MPQQQKTVLLVEDDQFIRELCYNSLTGDPKLAGVAVETALTGNEAIEKLKQFGAGINLVLLDIILPNKNGFEILEYMKSDPALKSIPVVVLSNLGQEEDVQKAKRLGADDFMIKVQSDTSEIVDKVKSYLLKEGE